MAAANERAPAPGESTPRHTPSRIRILYVIDSLVAGGVESQMVDLISRLDLQRFEPRALVFYGAPARPPHFLPRLQELGVAVEMLNLGPGARDKLEAWQKVIAAAWRLRPHIIQAENYHANLLTRAARPLAPRGTRLIGTIRAADSPHQLRLERLGWRACAVIVASADHLKRQLMSGAGLPGERIVVIPNSIDVERFRAVVGRGVELRARLAAGAQRLVVSMGRISPEKRMDLLAGAVALLKRTGVTPKDARVAMIGPTEQAGAQQALDHVIEREALSEMILQLPTVPDPETYFAASDASALASPVEGLPIVALESLAAGKPVILSQGANASGVIEDGVTGWVARSNAPADLAEALRRMLSTSDEDLARMAERCRAEAGRYSLDALARRYMALYEALVSLSTTRPAERMKALGEATK